MAMHVSAVSRVSEDEMWWFGRARRWHCAAKLVPMSPTPMYPLSTLPSSLVALLVVFPLSSEAFSLSWPFAKKRFTDEGLIDAASLGLVGFKGRIAALGDWNGDQL